MRVREGGLCLFSELGVDWKPRATVSENRGPSWVRQYSVVIYPGIEYHRQALCQRANGVVAGDIADYSLGHVTAPDCDLLAAQVRTMARSPACHEALISIPAKKKKEHVAAIACYRQKSCGNLFLPNRDKRAIMV